MENDKKEIKITPQELRAMSIFYSATGRPARDCVIDQENNRIIFLVNPEDVALAIGKAGANVKRAASMLGKSVEVVEYSPFFEGLTKNVLAPVRVVSVRQEGDKVVIRVRDEDRGLAIGSGGRTANKLKLILNRYFGVKDVSIKRKIRLAFGSSVVRLGAGGGI
ncbi:MAG: NusA-like transcription termination signal-binding factor [Thermoprotei archaeon]|nr:NusA-like transcription termination signal-binding factor [TACK group archaeon]